jgi:hypothetical protein
MKSIAQTTVLRIVAALIAGGIAALAIVSWYYSDQLIRPRRPEAMEPSVKVFVVGGETITLADRPGTRKPGTWVLEWPSGYGRVGALRTRHDGKVEREFTALRGSPTPGMRADLNPFGFEEEPEAQFHLEHRQIVIPSEIGGFPAWLLEGKERTWMILVHGMGATRAEGLRVLHETADLGIPSLVITYRNDQGAPRSSDGLSHLGATEWRDLEAVVEYSLQRGARDLILVGFSTGGALIARFLLESRLASSVRGVILDAPVLDWRATTAHYAQNRNIPVLFARTGTAVAGWRVGLRWSELEPLARADRLRAPMLVFHGTADPIVPLWTSESLAVRRPDLVTLVRIPGAGHVESWNFDSKAYSSALHSWLGRMVSREP